jgi:uncharacterized membrane-anchored protein
MRLASLKYLPSLRKVGAKLADFDQRVKSARDALDPHKPSTPESADVTDLMGRAHNAFSNMTSGFNEETKTTSGILYRIERSRYYVEQFRQSLNVLRLLRIEGYQRYDQFVERRLGPVFDYIDRLGRRYERAANSLSALDQYYLSMQANSLLQRETDLLERENEIGERANSINTSIQQIQKWVNSYYS